MLDPGYYDSLSEQMHKFAQDQLSHWTLASTNFREIRNAPHKAIELNGLIVDVINIPSRSISTKAKTDEKSLSMRPCFLCPMHRPVEQDFMSFEGAKGKKYFIQLNPYPILPEHFVIPTQEHVAQSIWGRYVDMLRLCKRRPGFTIIYNGPRCGASAPDHFHFQAFPSGLLPLEKSVRAGENLRFLDSMGDARLYDYTAYSKGIFVIRAKTSKSMNRMFYRLLDCVPMPEGDNEPRFNLISWYKDGEYTSMVVFRRCHRSWHYFSDDPAEHVAMSPGTVDMGGMFVTIRQEDFLRLDSALLNEIIADVTMSEQEHEAVVARLTRRQPVLEIPVLRCKELEFEMLSYGAGRRKAKFKDGQVEYGGEKFDELYFEAKNPSTMFAEPSFVLYSGPDCSGYGGKEAKAYAGSMRISVTDSMLEVTNVIGLEDFVYSKLSACAQDMEVEDIQSEAVSLRKTVLDGSACMVDYGLPCVSAEQAKEQIRINRAEARIKWAIDATWDM